MGGVKTNANIVTFCTGDSTHENGYHNYSFLILVLNSPVHRHVRLAIQ